MNLLPVVLHKLALEVRPFSPTNLGGWGAVAGGLGGAGIGALTGLAAAPGNKRKAMLRNALLGGLGGAGIGGLSAAGIASAARSKVMEPVDAQANEIAADLNPFRPGSVGYTMRQMWQNKMEPPFGDTGKQLILAEQLRQGLRDSAERAVTQVKVPPSVLLRSLINGTPDVLADMDAQMRKNTKDPGNVAWDVIKANNPERRFK